VLITLQCNTGWGKRIGERSDFSLLMRWSAGVLCVIEDLIDAAKEVSAYIYITHAVETHDRPNGEKRTAVRLQSE